MINQLEWLIGGLGFIWIVVWFVINIFICVWVYKDAQKNNQNGAVWLLIVLIFGCVGCCIYLLVRKS